MERLAAAGFAARLRRPGWETQRLVRAALRRTGLFWPGLFVCAAAAAAGLALGRGQAAQAGLLAARPAAAALAPASGPADAGRAGARSRLHAFDAHLLPHGDIPFALQDLLALGAAEGLTMRRGSYRAQPDIAGEFLHYRMSLPVQGSAGAIRRFMNAALRKQKNLALDGVQFKRSGIGSQDIEARIDWVLLVSLPGAVR